MMQNDSKSEISSNDGKSGKVIVADELDAAKSKKDCEPFNNPSHFDEEPMDLFHRDDVRELLKNKFVLILGDSNMRALYKDMVHLLNHNTLTPQDTIRRRGEESFEGDERFIFKGMTKGRDYVESRRFCKFDTSVEFHFIVKCYTKEIDDMFKDIKGGKKNTPDAVIMNSCIWDVSRWGTKGVEEYKINLELLFKLLKDCLPETTQIIWSSAFPVSPESVKGGLLVRELQHIETWLCFEIVFANAYVENLTEKYRFTFVNVHKKLLCDIFHRLPDGIHYDSSSMRLVLNNILSHIAVGWKKELPRNLKNLPIIENIEHIKAPWEGSNEARVYNEDLLGTDTLDEIMEQYGGKGSICIDDDWLKYVNQNPCSFRRIPALITGSIPPETNPPPSTSRAQEYSRNSYGDAKIWGDNESRNLSYSSVDRHHSRRYRNNRPSKRGRCYDRCDDHYNRFDDRLNMQDDYGNARAITHHETKYENEDYWEDNQPSNLPNFPVKTFNERYQDQHGNMCDDQSNQNAYYGGYQEEDGERWNHHEDQSFDHASSASSRSFSYGDETHMGENQTAYRANIWVRGNRRNHRKGRTEYYKNGRCRYAGDFNYGWISGHPPHWQQWCNAARGRGSDKWPEFRGRSVYHRGSNRYDGAYEPPLKRKKKNRKQT